MINPSDIVYGGIDGSITTFAIMTGAIGSHQSSATVIILSLASLFADGFSMGVSAYESAIYRPEFALTKGLTTFISFIAIGAIPIIIYYLYRDAEYRKKLYATIVSALGCIFIIGMYRYYSVNSIIDTGDMLLSGLKTSSLGALTATIAYYVAQCLENMISYQEVKCEN